MTLLLIGQICQQFCPTLPSNDVWIVQHSPSPAETTTQFMTVPYHNLPYPQMKIKRHTELHLFIQVYTGKSEFQILNKTELSTVPAYWTTLLQACSILTDWYINQKCSSLRHPMHSKLFALIQELSSHFEGTLMVMERMSHLLHCQSLCCTFTHHPPGESQIAFKHLCKALISVMQWAFIGVSCRVQGGWFSYIY